MASSTHSNEYAHSIPIPVPERVQKGALINSQQDYLHKYAESIHTPEAFWKLQAEKNITWFSPFTKVFQGGFEQGDVAWFLNGKLNVSYNCIDRHLDDKGDKVAIIWEGDTPDQIQKITYNTLFQETCRVANGLKSLGVRKGDPVAIYMPNTPQAVYAMLACARIGAVHSVVFAGFSSESLANRIQDCSAKVVLASDVGYRGGRVIHLRKTVEEALLSCPTVTHVVIHKRVSNVEEPHIQKRKLHDLHDHVTFISLDELMNQQRPYCVAEAMDSEDPLFFLYTSGSTGKPKGVLHTQAGYLLGVSITHKYVFDAKDDDIFACMADIGWITGHSYIVYGPLCNGSTTFMFEGVPTHPNPGRYWDMVARHKITQLYTAPTAIRTLMKFGDSHVVMYDRSSLRVLGSVGEPINPNAWVWYYEVVGEKKCSIVDTYWQTETGAHILTPLPGATPLKPGSATFPFFGISVAILDPLTGAIKDGEAEGVLAITRPWPSMARTVYGDHARYLQTYMKAYPGFYFTGDSVRRDADGYYWIEGRVDDVINVSGHRMSTAELEGALVGHGGCAEAAVVGFPHDIKGQGIAAYCILKVNNSTSDEHDHHHEHELRNQIRKSIGPFASPDIIIITPSLPKTRSGKIMRRILRKIAAQETDSLGDTSSLAEPEVVPYLIEKLKKKLATKHS